MLKEKQVMVPLVICSGWCLITFFVWVNSLGRETWRVIFSSTGLLLSVLLILIFFKKIRQQN